MKKKLEEKDEEKDEEVVDSVHEERKVVIRLIDILKKRCKKATYLGDLFT